MSLREKGNQEFKNNNIQKAIECYLQYVQQDNKDNQLAYTNLAMCYFKLKDYPKTIQACEHALTEKKQCFKAYYRLYLTYMEIPNEQYQVFINATLFLKYLNDENTSARADAMKIARDYKEKFIAKRSGREVKIEGNIIEDLQRISLESFEIGKETNQVKTIEQWQQYFLDEQVEFVQKCECISEMAESHSYEEGINLAYFFLNLTAKQQQKNFIKQFIAKIKRDHSEQLKQDEVKQEHKQTVIVNEEMNDQSQENLFASESESIHKEKEPAKEGNYEEQRKQTIYIKQQPLRPQVLKIQESKPALPQLHNEDSINKKIKEFLDSTGKSRDMFKDLKDNICKLLESNEQLSMKKLYLTRLHQKCKQVDYIKHSFQDNWQRQIYKLLTLNDLSQLCPIYAPKGK